MKNQILKHSMIALFLGLGIIACEKDDKDPSTPTDTGNITDTTKTTVDDTTMSTVDPTKANTLIVGTEEFKATGAGFASGQSAATITTPNALNINNVRLFWSNGDTGNGLKVPANGTYTLIQADNGSVTETGKVAIRITVSNDVFAFYSSIAGGTVEVSTVNGYTTYKIKGATLNQVVTGTSKGLTPSSIKVSGMFGGDPRASSVNTISATSKSYVLNNEKAEVTKVTLNYAGDGEVNAYYINDYLIIYFKSKIGVPADGEYNVIDGGAYASYSSSFITNAANCQIKTASGDTRYYSISNAGKLTISTVGGKKNVKFENVFLTENSKDVPPYYALSGDFELN